METNSDTMKAEIEKYMSDNPCPKCKGARLKPEALAVTVGGKNIFEFTSMAIREELDFINSINFSEKDKIISSQIIKRNSIKIKFLNKCWLRLLRLS